MYFRVFTSYVIDVLKLKYKAKHTRSGKKMGILNSSSDVYIDKT